jgi:hypothetical protein
MSGPNVINFGSQVTFLNGVVFLNGVALTLPNAASHPVTAVTGDMYYNTTTNTIQFFNGTAWTDIGSAATLAATGSYASFTGTIPGTSTPVTITANIAGTSGNSIALVFPGGGGSPHSIINTINAWNVANPSNTATLTSGSGGQIPTIAGTTMLSGGTAAGSDLIGNSATYTNFTPATATVSGALAGINAALSNYLPLAGGVITDSLEVGTDLQVDGNTTLFGLNDNGALYVNLASALDNRLITTDGAGNFTLGNWQASPIDITYGGTGQTTASSAFNALAPATLIGGLIVGNGTSTYTNLPIGSAGYVLTSNGTTAAWISGAVGSVTSVGLADTSTTPIYMITNSPVTSAGTLDISLLVEPINTVFSGPAFGSSAQPTFRTLVPADVAFLSQTGFYASFTGTISGTSTPVTITANNPGSAGNSIAFVFTGSNSISAAITAWNIANPLNQATLTAGNGTQIPTVQVLTLSGGSDAGSFLIGETSTYTNFTPTSNTIAGVLAGINAALGQDANVYLSNLVSPTAINQSLLVNANNSFDLGSSAIAWATVYAYSLVGGLTAPSIDLHIGTASDLSGIVSIDWQNRLLDDFATLPSLDWQKRQLFSTLPTELISIDWQARQLKNNSGLTTLDWSATGTSGHSGIIFSYLTANTVPYLDAGQFLTSSVVTPIELGYLSGVTSAIQTQLNAKSTSTLPSGDIFVGNGSNIATAVTLSGDASISNTGVLTLSNSAVTGQLLTGYTSAAGTVTAADSILTAIEKLNGNDALYLLKTGDTMSGVINMGGNKITNMASGTVNGDALQWGQIGAANGIAGLDGTGRVPTSQLPITSLQFEGAWNPNTNTPMLADGTGTGGFVYYVSAADPGTVAGLSDPSMTNFQVGNLIIYNGTLAVWQQVPTATGIASVNGQTGVVVINAINQLTGDITTTAAVGSQSEVATIAAIQGTTVTGTTGTGNVVFSASPTLTGTIAAGSMTLTGTLVATSAISGSNLTSGGHAILDLPLTGGTLSGTLTGTSIILSGTLAATGTISGSNLTTGGHAFLDLLASNNLSDVASTITAFNNISPMTTAGDITYELTAAHAARLAIGTIGQVLTVSGSLLPAWTTPATSGTVTSVALSDGSTTPIYTITGSPVTSTGTLTFSLATQAAHTFFAGPTSGSAQPSFRAIIATDIPTLNQNTTGTASNVTGTVAIINGGTGQTTASSAFNALAPATTTGGLIAGSGVNTYVNLSIGTTGQVLTVVGGIPAWATSSSNGFAYLDSNTSVYGGTNSTLTMAGGSDNTVVGVSAGNALSSGTDNTLFGYTAGSLIATSNFNTAIGSKALVSNTASNNTALGYKALFANTTGTSNTAIGYLALAANTGASNSNTAVGYNALAAYNGSTGLNTAVGYSALALNTSGAPNTAVGCNALSMNTTGSGNTAVGYGVLSAMIAGAQNTAMGQYSLDAATGNNGTAIGWGSLQNCTVNDGNTAVGMQSGNGITSGYQNTCIGYQAGKSGSNPLTTGNNCTFLGSQAVTTGTVASQAFAYMTAIGSGSAVGTANTIVLGRTTDTTVIGATGTSGQTAALQVTGHVQIIDGSQGTGKVLTSDTNGVGTWTAATTLSGLGIRAGTQSVSSGSVSQAITFSTSLGSTSYAISAQFVNTTDSTPQFQPITITAQSATGFTASWNAPTATANYSIQYMAVLNV